MTDLARLGGIMTGVVVDLDDPERLGRVRVRFDVLDGTTSAWARLVSSGAGADRGLFQRPEPGDEVLVAFELGDMRRPYVLGGLWNRVDPPPADDGDPSANTWRMLRSRSGHVIRLDDSDGAESILVEDKDGKRRVRIDCAGDEIVIEGDSGDVRVVAHDGGVAIESNADLTLTSRGGAVEVVAISGKVSVEAVDVSIRAKGSLALEAGGDVSIKGSVVRIN